MPRHPFMPRRSPAARRAARIVAAIALIVDRAWTRRGARRGGRRADDGGAHPARRSRPARVVGRDRGPPQERRPGDHAASSGSRAARRARRSSGWPSSCRPSPTRSTSCTPSRRRSARDLRSPWSMATATVATAKATFTTHDATPARRRGRRRASRADRRQPRPAAEPEPGRTGRRDPDPGRPARTRRGLGRDRPDRLAGRRLGAAVDAAA